MPLTIAGCSIENAAIIVSVFYWSLTAALAYLILREAKLPRTMLGECAVAGLAMSTLLVHPIVFATLFKHNIFFGYILPANVYHNPTVIAARPLSLLAFMYLLRFVKMQSDRPSWRPLAIGAFWLTAATFAKPNFTLCLIPALACFSIWFLLKSRFSGTPTSAVQKRIVIATICFGSIALAVLGWQFSITYGQNSVNTIAFLPFAIVSKHSGFVVLAFRILMSLLFPLAIACLFLQEARKDLALGLAWLSMAVAFAWYYGFVELGPRLKDGNFGWGASICLYILFVYSIRLLLNIHNSTSGDIYAVDHKKTAISICVYMLHIASGIIWIAVHLLQGSRQFWN